MAKWLRCLRLSECGQGLVEYSLLMSIVAIALIAVLLSLRNGTGKVYAGAGDSLGQVVGCSYGSTPGTCPAGIVTATGGGSGNGNGNGSGSGNGRGNNGNGNGNGGGNGSNGKGGGKGNQP
jgi:Flp pilus assembly pilin Flp